MAGRDEVAEAMALIAALAERSAAAVDAQTAATGPAAAGAARSDAERVAEVRTQPAVPPDMEPLLHGGFAALARLVPGATADAMRDYFVAARAEADDELRFSAWCSDRHGACLSLLALVCRFSFGARADA